MPPSRFPAVFPVRWFSLAVVFGLFCAVVSSPAAAPAPRETDIKAAFLYKLGIFIEWPDTAFASAEAPFVIGVLGDDPFGPILNELVAGEQINGHPMVIRRLTSRQLDEAESCHVLFICASESRRLRSIIQRLRGRPVLTVADTPGFLELGGAIDLTTDGSIHLTINAAALRTAHLTASSKLMRLAQVVEKEDTAP